MGRWKPDARGRLEQAALELYAELGFERTTVKDIAHRADLTERTFFRHFADKREVLFPASQPLEAGLVAAVREVPAGQEPLAVLMTALRTLPDALEDRRELARRRSAIVAAVPGLQERELAKMASLTDALARELHDRGVPELPARLAAESAAAVFRTAFTRWITPEAPPADLGALLDRSLAELQQIVAAG
ncbi:TetR/AcrR family transcriptional regulator [Streptomyces sp. NPDC049813]|uniref:TetR/AcrR family transcriptional regulator n=1 Tax=Streptomyces sp. NPDC049813 TaxID=3365597 RepID=UPI003795408E